MQTKQSNNKKKSLETNLKFFCYKFLIFPSLLIDWAFRNFCIFSSNTKTEDFLKFIIQSIKFAFIANGGWRNFNFAFSEFTCLWFDSIMFIESVLRDAGWKIVFKGNTSVRTRWENSEKTSFFLCSKFARSQCFPSLLYFILASSSRVSSNVHERETPQDISWR